MTLVFSITRRKPVLSPALRNAILAGGLAILSGCTPLLAPTGTQGPDNKLARSGESMRLERYYATLQDRLRSRGLMRTDVAPPDAPVTTASLIRDFEQIALFDEYAVAGGSFIARQTPSTLRRWNKPIRISLLFDERISKDARARDRADVVAYARRLSRLTGVPISVTEKNPNFHVMFLYHDRQKTIGPELLRRIPDLSPIVVREIENTPRNTYCVTYAFADRNNGSAYDTAVILIKAEHPDLMRLSCIHEEMAQAMGLANDSPDARPSIFNDDEEFALLTRHDEMLLRMLYDKRLKVGMTLDQARAVLPAIARDVMKGSS